MLFGAMAIDERKERCAPVVDRVARPAHWSEALESLAASHPVKYDEIVSNMATRPPATDTPSPESVARLLRGRPTAYKPEFCQLVQEDMVRGYSLSAFAALIGVDRRTVSEWCVVHPEFHQAVARGKSQRLRAWETRALDVATTGGSGSQGTMVIFGLKNMGTDEWREKQEIAHSGNVSLSALIGDSMKTIDHEPVTIEHSEVIEG